MSEVLGGERDSQDSNPGSLNLESGFQLQCYTSGATSGLEGLSQREGASVSTSEEEGMRHGAGHDHAVILSLSPSSCQSLSTHLLLREGDTGVRHRLCWAREGRDQTSISSSHFNLLFIKPALSATRVSDTVFSSLYMWTQRGQVTCPRSTALKGEGCVWTQMLSKWWHAVPSLSLWERSTPCEGFLTEILGSA